MRRTSTMHTTFEDLISAHAAVVMASRTHGGTALDMLSPSNACSCRDYWTSEGIGALLSAWQRAAVQLTGPKPTSYRPFDTCGIPWVI